MPVVTVAAPSVGEAEVETLLGKVAGAVAAALDLGDGDVLAVHEPTGPTVASGGVRAAPWIVLTIHGSGRGEAERVAATRAEDAVRAWAADAGVPLGGVWASWIVRA